MRKAKKNTKIYRIIKNAKNKKVYSHPDDFKFGTFIFVKEPDKIIIYGLHKKKKTKRRVAEIFDIPEEWKLEE